MSDIEIINKFVQFIKSQKGFSDEELREKINKNKNRTNMNIIKFIDYKLRLV